VPDLSRIVGVTLAESWIYRGALRAQERPSDTDAAIYGVGDPAYAFPATDCVNGRERLLIFHDSFVEAMIPYLSDSFCRVIYVRRFPSFNELRAGVKGKSQRS
jgi:hypothetical protein